MKCIIAGSRSFNSYEQLDGIVSTYIIQLNEVVSGGAKGADLLGEKWAKRCNIPVKRFIPDWSMGKRAGPMRNREMAEYADMLIAFWDGKSRGTRDMINKALGHGLEVHVYQIGNE